MSSNSRQLVFVLTLSGVLRLACIAYASWHDKHADVRFTDIDYDVFTDGARLAASWQSPYERSTYRYSPLMAFLLLPNVWCHEAWGKLLFSAVDLVVGWQLHRLLLLLQPSLGAPVRLSLCALWLANPATWVISARGSCESLPAALLLLALTALVTDRLVEASVWFGIAVHFRVYPIIFVFCFLFFLDDDYPSRAARKSFQKRNKPSGQENQKIIVSPLTSFKAIPNFIRFFSISFENFLNQERIIFGLVSGGTFFLLTGIFYFFYGETFLHESLFYHLSRTDHRHNFSIYFYPIYLGGQSSPALLLRLLAFAPQVFVQIVLASKFSKDLPFCLFVQTLAFVTFNKVVTAQYFVWFLWLLPLILPNTTVRFWSTGFCCTFCWLASFLNWLFWAYRLEFKGENVLGVVWMASLFFFVNNVSVLIVTARHHRTTPVFCDGKLTSFQKQSE